MNFIPENLSEASENSTDKGCGFRLINLAAGTTEWKILLPVDGSTPSQRATMYLVDLVECLPASVMLLHCWEPPVLGRAIKSKSEQAENEARQSAAICAVILERAGLQHSVEVRMGRPADLIVETAVENNCDLIVMGSRGHTGLEGIILGSVTMRVLQTAPCPVLVV